MSIGLFLHKMKPDGSTDVLAQGFYENFIYYGMSDIPGLLDPIHSLDSLVVAIRLVHPEYRQPNEARMFWRFSRIMKAGDLVLVPQKQFISVGKSQKKAVIALYAARVVGEALYSKEHTVNSTAYRRAVHWLNDRKPFFSKDFSPEFYKKTTRAPCVYETCSDLSEYAPEISLLIDPLTDVTASPTIKFSDFQQSFNFLVDEGLKLGEAERRRQIEASSRKPATRGVIRYEFVRNPYVVAETLIRANGFCEQCKLAAPFLRKSDGTPYLEVHHIVTLADDGDDHPDNTIAVCPNCHRYAHHG